MKRKDGRYCVRVYLGRVDGEKKYRYCYGVTQEEADAKAVRLKAQLLDGLDALSPESLDYWIAAYVEQKRTTCRAPQVSLVASRLEYFSRWNGRDWNGGRQLGSVRICDVAPVQLQEVLNALMLCNPYTGKPTAKNTLKPIKEAIYGVFENAVFNRALTFNPAARLFIGNAAPRSERRALSQAERDLILSVPHRAQLPALLMMLCGLRRGEATALRWTDVDLDRASITVSRSYDFKAEETKSPKTSSGSRVVPIPAPLLPFLRSAKNCSGADYVVVTAAGGRMTESAWKRLLESYLSTLNAVVVGRSKFDPSGLPRVIEPFGWHCLRHTYATILFEAGVSASAARDLLGHADVKTTLNIYTHLMDAQRLREAEKLDLYLQR